MNDMIGMDTEEAAGVLHSVGSLSGNIDSIQERLAEIRMMSLNPSSAFVDPASLILAPESIIASLAIANELTNAKNNIGYLLTLLGQEIEQQKETSQSLTPQDKGWDAKAPTATAPGEVSLWDEAWEGISDLVSVANPLATLTSDVSDAFKAAVKIWQDAPPWVKTGAKLAERGGKVVPVLGAVVGTVSVFTDWDPNYVWGNTRNIVGASLNIVEVVCLIPPLDPAEIVVAPLADLWNSMDAVWDIGDDMNWKLW
jgi:hypothetical protein